MDKKIEQVIEDYTQIVKEIEQTKKENKDLKLKIYEICEFVDEVHCRLEKLFENEDKNK